MVYETLLYQDRYGCWVCRLSWRDYTVYGYAPTYDARYNTALVATIEAMHTARLLSDHPHFLNVEEARSWERDRALNRRLEEQGI